MNHPAIQNRKRRWYDKLAFPLKKLAKWSTALVALVLFIFIIFICTYGWRASDYDINEVVGRNVVTQVFDDEGHSMGSPYVRDRIVIKYEQLPRHFIAALLAREDASFEDHNGTDVPALIRAIFRNTKDMAYTQGGSTITMQLARQVYELGGVKSLDRKFLEIALARRIENNYSKQVILESYLNRIYFGAGAYGVGDAAKTYFGKPVSELTLGESAMLVGVIRGPSIYNPFANEKLAIQERNTVLDRMVEEGMLEPEAAKKEKNLPVSLKKDDTNCQISYPLKWAKREMDLLLSRNEEEKDESRGVYLYSTFHLPLQRHVERTVELTMIRWEQTQGWQLPTRDKDPINCIQAAVFVVRPNTGSVIAVVGGRDPMVGRDVWEELECPMGELFFPVVYAAASESSRFIVNGNPFETAQKVDRGFLEKVARNLGIEEDFPSGELMVAGMFSRKLVDNIPLILAIHNGGSRPELRAIKTIATPKGAVLYSLAHEVKKTKVESGISADAAKEAYKAPPFRPDTLKNVKSIRMFLLENKGAFSAKIHNDVAVFAWVGQSKPSPSLYQDSKFVSKLSDKANELCKEVISFMLSLPMDDVKLAPTVTPAPKPSSSGRSGNRR